MTSLRERFDDALANPAPPHRASGAEVYATAWHRRRVRNRLVSAAAAGGTALVVAAVLLVGGGRDRAAPTPADEDMTTPPPAPTETTDNRPYPWDGVVMQAVATDAQHLYAIRAQCASDDSTSCVSVLLGSDDGGATWTERKRGVPDPLEVLAPGVLGAIFPSGAISATSRFSADGGRTWKDQQRASGTIPAVPAGGWPACLEDNSGILRCEVYGVNPQTGTQRKLATQPPSMIPTGLNRVPPGAGLWVSGYVEQSNRTGLSVSRDNGRTWTTHVFGKGEADYPQDINNQQVSVATVDGTTAYAVVSVVTNNGRNRLLIYRTGDHGLTWQRADQQQSPPWVQHGDASFLAADGTHVVQTVVEHPAEWYAGRTGTYTKPASMTGLEQLDHMDQPVRTVAPGAYLLYDRAAVYTSPDGLRWTRHPVQ